MSSVNKSNGKWKIIALTTIILFVGIGIILMITLNDTNDLRNDDSFEIDFIEPELSKSFLLNVTDQKENMRIFLECDNIELQTEIKEHGQFYILQNFVKSQKSFECHESITYVTHCDITFLDNVIPLVQRWKGPISVAIYAPGSDFNSTLAAIYYLRNCIPEKEQVKLFVTFHIFFDKEFYNDKIHDSYNRTSSVLLCSESEKFLKVNRKETYKTLNNLTYAINVARNLARNSSTTHLVLVSDIELYPSINFVNNFFNMLINKYSGRLKLERNVFVFPIFEVEADQDPPKNKSELIILFNANKAIWFHYKICPTCHEIPNAEKWLKDTQTTELIIASSNKRIGKFHHWEPLYVGTKNEPWYDERLNWEGKSDKMTQAYIMCLLDYKFYILSNAFLVHRPGIKTSQQARRPIPETLNRKIIKDEIQPEIERQFKGGKEGCKMF